jgi:hypothetical protein
MEIILNKNTKVDVLAKTSLFKIKHKKNEDIIRLRNDKVYAGKLVKKSFFSVKTFFLFILLGVLGGYGQFMYDTQYLRYNPNPRIISGIILVFLVIGFVVAQKKRRVLMLTVDSAKSSEYVFPMDKTTDLKKVEDFIEIIVN